MAIDAKSAVDGAAIQPHRTAGSGGFDRRTKGAKRFEALIKEFIADTGEVALTEARMAMVRQLATVVMQTEDYQARIVRGEAVDAGQLVRLTNVQARLSRMLGVGRSKAPAPQRTLRDKLAERRSAAA